MKQNASNSSSLIDHKINVKLKLALLWTTLMFLYIYTDYFDLMTPGAIEAFKNQQSPIGPITPGLLVVFATTLMIPSFMIFLPIVLKPRICKWLNIVVAGLLSVISILLLIDTLGSKWHTFYAINQVAELIVFAIIIWQAWKWPKQES
ncbi:DUF6326 family protein [Aureisphaera galaxeae]|uniref:DUF6326 family protein n=1 Tax=Aureisphaera galaxeae TaxID=1538023 RepID=UPI002350E46B|nr:DUF6326 family protein [Aureisphaera galaxeae]MDC8004139.1 DUF6326 family protein [Aureisphaera galaxeae]